MLFCEGEVYFIQSGNAINLNTMRLDISLPAKLVSRIDAYSRQYQMTRSAFFGLAAQEIMNRNYFFGPL